MLNGCSNGPLLAHLSLCRTNVTHPADNLWQRGDRFLEMRSHWFTLIGEHWVDHQGHPLEYWRVERADSAIVLPLQADQLLLPRPTYRPGVGAATYDFPGGRVVSGQSPASVAQRSLERELAVPPTAILQLRPLNSTGWAVNSSFSNQVLYGFVADLSPDHRWAEGQIDQAVPATADGLQSLLQCLTCLQCRAILLEWWLEQRALQDSNL